jgi:hypothetical protein
MLNILKNTINRVFASGVDSDASAFITATGLSDTTQKSAITTLVKDLKSSGLWSKMKAVYPMVTDNYNLLSYTEDITNGVWGKNASATFSANTTTAPNGTLTADTIGSNGGVSSSIFQLADNNGNGVYTASIYVKQKINRYFKLSLTGYSGATQRYAVIVDMSNGTLVSELNTSPALTNKSYSIVDAGNGWYRISVTATVPSSSFVYLVLECTNSTSTSINTSNLDYINATAGECYIWGAQIQTGALSTYQPILTTPSAFMSSQMKYNLKDARDLDAAFRLTWSGGWTYSATGATPNGTNGYIDTNLVGNTNISQGNFGFGIYSRTNSSTVGAYGINGALHIYPKYTDGNTYYRIFGGGSAVTGQTTLGLIYGFNDSTSTSYGWFNGVKKQTTPSSNYTIPSTNLMFAGNVTGTGGYDSRQLSFGFASLYLNDSEAQLLNQIVEKYQVALSRGVQAAQSFYYNSAYSNEANTYLYSTQITGTTQVSAINTLINGLKANNLWTKMKAVYPFVTDYRNLVAYTQSFTNAYWDKSITTVIDANTTDPNGITTASKLTEAAGIGSHHIHNSTGSFTPVVGQAYAMSCYVKQTPTATNRYVQLPFFLAGFGSNAYVNFDVQTGVVGTIGSSITSYSITLGNDGWYRITATATATATGLSGFQLSFIPSSTSTRTESYTVTAGNEKSIYMWGVQIEMGSTVSVYQPVLGVNNYSTNVAAQMKFNLVNPQDSDAAFRLAFSGGWTYSTNGAQPNGTNGYADTKLNPTTAINKDNSHISFYSRTNVSLYSDMGSGNGNGTAFVLSLRYDALNAQLGMIGGLYPTNAVTSAQSIATGFGILSRTSSTLLKLFRNSTLLGSNTVTSGSVSSQTIYIGGVNDTLFPEYSSKQVAFSSIGDGLTDAEVALLNQLVTEYQTTLSRNV